MKSKRLTIGILGGLGPAATVDLFDKIVKHTLLLPSAASRQKHVMEAIYGKEGIKAGNRTGKPRALLRKAVRELTGQGVELIIMGCTEIPLALEASDAAVPLVDAADILAQAAVRRALRGKHAKAQ